MPAVLAEGLKKRFGKTEALCGVDFDVKRGTVLCVLGPNGAGKTTTVRILTTLLKPDAGRAMIDGIDVVAEPRRARARIGLTGQYAAVDERLTGRENLEHVARLFHLPGSEARQRAEELLERFNLQDTDGRVVKGYSGGMRRRLDIAMSLIARPSVLFLDEPTTGLDPRSRLAMWDLIDELVREGMSTLLTTQYLEEAERLADEIVVIDHGRVIARGTSSQLKAHAGGERVEVRVAEASDLERVGPLLRTAVEITAPERVDSQARTVLLPVRDGDDLVPRIVRLLDGAGVSVKDVVVHRPTLDDVFLQLTGHAADAGEDGMGSAGAPASSNGLANGKPTKTDPGGRG